MAILTTSADFVGAEFDSWRSHMKQAVRSLHELIEYLELPRGGSKQAGRVAEENINAIGHFPVFAPRPYLQRIRPGDWNDPLLRQILPVAAEDLAVDGFSVDPLAESSASQGHGILQKYSGRALLITTGTCAINCRYCFRRHFPYESSPKSREEWDAAISQIENDSVIQEIILSGGDPLTLIDHQFAALIQRLDAIDHLKRVRVHTRLPIVIPQRVTDDLLALVRATRLTVVIVVHSNHARELDANVADALKRLGTNNAMLLNQSVLLRGVNDNAASLIELSERLIECGVIPYYLHKNDPVAGTSHFEVPVELGIGLIEKMRSSLPGYAVPRFVQEIAGDDSKRILA
jgi:EF-P beta-lysylation protein EpmB